MAKALQVITLDDEEKSLVTDATKAGVAQTVGNAVSALIKKNFEDAQAVARAPQCDGDSLAAAIEGIDQTIALLDTLPGGVGASEADTLREAVATLRSARDLLN